MATFFFSSALILTITLSLLTIRVTSSLQLRFYQKACPQAESIVKRVVKNNFQKDPSLPGGLIRLYFHDCFIRGCDGSVLIDSEGDNVAEKEAPPNLSLRGFEIIDEIKLELEKHCQGIVSCADILALATRDSVALSGGLAYKLPTGRKDGTISRMADVHVPGPSFSIDRALTAFKNIGLDLDDLTTLLGAHSIGLCHCGFFIDRLYDFEGRGLADRDLDPELVVHLKQKCPRQQPNQVFNLSQDPTVFMNPSSNTNFKLDSAFYSSVIDGKALLQLDQGLAFTDLTSKLAAKYVNEPQLFRKKFAKAMNKLGNIGVLTAGQGEVRLNCRKVNKRG
ncbi:hypothetical protein MKW98_015547 [Papaver atlanticum]|uniref:Peroxidase n=1 Tax=Papaver atlanticum TaxID=357466 RepID=A0AAD4S4P8_9MAGN|nr:hypothetical protein MKW98_015547 [Papaver atlanticum]